MDRWVWARLRRYADRAAIIWDGRHTSYDKLLRRCRYWRERLKRQAISEGGVVVLRGDYSPETIALFLALVRLRCVIVPMGASRPESSGASYEALCRARHRIRVDTADRVEIQHLPGRGDHRLYEELRRRQRPGMVLFSSGSAGRPKAVVHDLPALWAKFQAVRPAFKTIPFFLYDHIGGLDTMFYALLNGGCLVPVPDRRPSTVLRYIEQYRVELLPVSPTFLNLVLLSEAYRHYDMSSLKRITYGTEPMPMTTLQRLHEILPDVELVQSYGLSELGALGSRSERSDSLWVKIGGDRVRTRVVDGMLQIKSPSAMLGYLNQESPFTEDGWLVTGDRVEVKGDYYKILGRDVEVINVGGQKVYPAEVEDVILATGRVEDVVVYGQPHPIMGQIVCADIRFKKGKAFGENARTLKQDCRKRLEAFKVPVKIKEMTKDSYGQRFKKKRIPRA